MVSRLVRIGNVQGALDELGVPFTVKGGEALMLCPYHDDHHVGSFSVNLETGEHNCFSCGKHGNFARLVAQIRECSLGRAYSWLRDRLGEMPVFEHTDAGTAPGKTDTSEQINEASLALFTAPPQIALDGRQIHAEAAAAYGLQWDKGTWVIPVRDPYSGALWGWQEKRGRYFRNYPDGIPKSDALFGAHLLDGCCAILVESPLDAARIASAGIPGAVSSYGAIVSQRQLTLIRERAPYLILALDNDQAGMAETVKICETFHEMDFTVFNYGDMDVKDPGDMTDDEIRWGIGNRLTRVDIGMMINNC